MAIENTTQREAILHLIGASSDGTEKYITDMEAAGQRQLVASEQLPVRSDGDDAYLAVGFTFGEADSRDALFRPATLPPGWTRQPTDHSMWSKIIDQHGRKRVSIFYKAAFYDRDAFMNLATPNGYLQEVLYDKRQPVLDDEWLTVEVARETLTVIESSYHHQADEAAELAARTGEKYWTDREGEHREQATRARRMREALS